MAKLICPSSLKIANELLRTNKLDDARREYQRLIELMPNFSWNYYYLGQLFVQEEKLPDAIAQYRQAIKLNPNSAFFHNSLAEVLMEQGKLDEAISCSQKAISLQAYFAIYHQTLAFAYEAKSDFVSAFKTWQKIIYINLNHLRANQKISWLQTNVAKICVESGNKLNQERKIKEAVEFYQQALILNPQQPMPIYRTCGNSLITLGRFEEAETVFQQLIKIYPELPDGYHGYARLTHSFADWELALKRWEEAIFKFPEHIGFQVQKGNALINLSQFNEAEAVFKRLKEKYPNQPQGYEGYARLTHYFADWNLALSRWENAISKFPENIGFQVSKGNVLINLSRFDEAEEVFQRLIEKYPNQPQGYDGYARVAHSLANWELALERWENAINHLPHHFNFYVQKGNVLINLFRYREAETLFEQLISKYPHQPQGFDGLARVSMHAQKWELALARWQTAIDKFPNNLAFLVGKANAYIELHKFDSAQDLADIILHQYPNHYQQKYAIKKNIVVRRYALERSIASLIKVEDYFKYLLSESEVSSITHPCYQILLESINSFAQTITNSTTLGIIGIVVKRLLDDCCLEVSPGEILACTFKKLITQKLGNKNLDLQQAEILCTQANFLAALDIYLNLGDEIIEEFIPDYSEHINRIFSQKIEHSLTAALPEKYGSLELAREALETDLVNEDFDGDSIYSQLGYLLVHIGESEKGLAYLNKRIEMSVYSQDAYIKLGHALLKLGKKESAFANYKQAVKLNFALALLSATLIEWVSSKYQQLVNSGCQKLGIYQQFSNLLVKQGLSKEALKVAHQVKTKFGDGYHSKKVLISILVAQGNKQQALEYHQQVLKENPKSADKNLRVLTSCNFLKKFENQTALRAILSDKFQIAYNFMPKCAGTTVKATMQWLENRQDDDSKIISMPKHQSHKMYYWWFKIENLAGNYFKFVVVREPIKRFLSAVSNKVFFSRNSFENDNSLTSYKYLSIAKLGVDPEINWLIENLESYLEMSQCFQHHIKPQYIFMGNQIKGFDRIFQVERLGELGEKLSEITGIEINLPRLNTGGRKISLAELSEKSMKKLIDFYARDYELLKDYYSPDKIWDEYQALKKAGSNT